MSKETIGIKDSRKTVIFRSAAAILATVALAAGCGGNSSAESPAHSEQTALTEHGENMNCPAHTVVASVYGIGEAADASNDYISNQPSAWSDNAVKDFGGDDPLEGTRNFRPLHNSFYFALPASEFDETGLIKGAREKSPWAKDAATLRPDESLFKGRWIEAVSGDKKIYAQWQDVGPNEEADYAYVFGDSKEKPKNTFGVKAGLDLSPDAARALGFGLSEGSAIVTWRFVDDSRVPDGPWRDFPAIDNKTHWG